MLKNRLKVLLIACAALGTAASADVQDRLRDELQLALVRMVESGGFEGGSSDSLNFSLDEPAQRVTNLGLLVDSSQPDRLHDGLRVLGVSPNSSAQHMGVRAGDVVMSVNGTSLLNLGTDEQGRALAPQRLREAIEQLPDGAQVRLGVRRADKSIDLAAALVSVTLPPIHLQVGRDELVADTATLGAGGRDRVSSAAAIAASGCGRLNWFDVAPRGQQLHPVKLLGVDGDTPGPNGITRFRVPAGVHTLSIVENIDADGDGKHLPFNSRLRRGNDRKTLSITVAANTTYYLAARLNLDKLTEWKGGGYWDPVVWKEVSESCE